MLYATTPVRTAELQHSEERQDAGASGMLLRCHPSRARSRCCLSLEQRNPQCHVRVTVDACCNMRRSQWYHVVVVGLQQLGNAAASVTTWQQACAAQRAPQHDRNKPHQRMTSHLHSVGTRAMRMLSTRAMLSLGLRSVDSEAAFCSGL